MRLIILILLISCFSCGKKSSFAKKDHQQIKLISKEILNDVYYGEKIGSKRFSKPQFFHIKFEPLNENTFVVKVALNSFKPIENYCDSLAVNGIKAFIYLNDCKYQSKNTTATDPFFVPDALNLEFLVRWKNHRVFSYKKIDYYHKGSLGETDEIDF